MFDLEYIPVGRMGRPVDKRLHPTPEEVAYARRYAEDFIQELSLDDPTLKDEHGKNLCMARVVDNITGIVLSVIEAHKKRDLAEPEEMDKE